MKTPQMPPVGFWRRGVLRGPHPVFAEHGFPDALGHPFPVLDSYDVAHVFGFLGVSLSAQPQESVGIVRQRSHVCHDEGDRVGFDDATPADVLQGHALLLDLDMPINHVSRCLLHDCSDDYIDVNREELTGRVDDEDICLARPLRWLGLPIHWNPKDGAKDRIVSRMML